jgi:hypothetical protein
MKALWIRVLASTICVLPWVAAAAPASGAIYQYSVPVESRRAYLWIPPRCTEVRGIVISFANLLERNWLEDPIIRDATAAECLGTVWLRRGRSVLTADMKSGAGEALRKLMGDLAEESGYPEIRWAPFISMGHSANGQLSWNIPNWAPERTIAAIPIKTVPLPPSLGFGGVPLCYVVGETTEWPQYRDGRAGDRDFFWPVVRDSAVALRSASENNLAGVVTDPGGGHFDWSERQARFVALYIRKACQYRLPKHAPGAGPVRLKPLRPEAGWLTDTGGVEPDRFPPAPYAKYQGDPKKAYWFFDEETARAAAAFCGDRKKREKQMLTFVQNGEPLPVARQGFAPLEFLPGADGMTFRVEGAFLSELPGELIGAGAKLGHAQGPILFRVITGPAVQTGPDTFRVRFDREGMGGTLWLREEHPGDGRYRHAVQPGQMTIPAKLTQGRPQTIAFPAIGNRKRGTPAVALNATSDSGLAVEYYVVAGPAEAEGSTLRITAIPVKSKYPVKVTVVAYQWGRTTEPLHQSAEPVEQTLWIEK